jgi:hypothetical protein
MVIRPSSFVVTLMALAAGALVIVVGISRVRSRALAENGQSSNSERGEWMYVAAVWLMVILLGVAFHLVGWLPLRLSIPLAFACTLGVLGLIWPAYMQDPRFTPAQHVVQRVVMIVVGGILIAIASGHFG